MHWHTSVLSKHLAQVMPDIKFLLVYSYAMPMCAKHDVLAIAVYRTLIVCTCTYRALTDYFFSHKHFYCTSLRYYVEM